MIKRRRGFTVLEVMIAAGLLFTIILGSMWEFFRRTGNQSKEIFEETGLALEVERAYAVLEREVFNSAFLLDPEGLNSVSDRGYSGLATLNGNQAAVATALGVIGCNFEAGTSPLLADRYSVLRYSTVNSKLFPERSRGVWNEIYLNSSNVAPDILNTFVHPANSQFVFENGVKNSDEIYIQDADSRGFRRYRVLSSQLYQGPINPETNANEAPTSFKYTKSTLAMPHTFTGDDITPVDRVFITGSSVYSIKTKVTCIDTQGQLIQRTQYGPDSTTSTVLLKPETSGHRFSSFAVSFANLGGDRSSLIRNISFYNWLASTNNHWRECLNVVKIGMNFTELATSKTKSFSKTFLINSKNIQRAADCDSVVNP